MKIGTKTVWVEKEFEKMLIEASKTAGPTNTNEIFEVRMWIELVNQEIVGM